MSEGFFLPGPPLMSALQAREVARAYKALADHMAGLGASGEAGRLERSSQWWLGYALVLDRVPPGSSEP